MSAAENKGFELRTEEGATCVVEVDETMVCKASVGCRLSLGSAAVGLARASDASITETRTRVRMAAQ